MSRTKVLTVGGEYIRIAEDVEPDRFRLLIGHYVHTLSRSDLLALRELVSETCEATERQERTPEGGDRGCEPT